MKTLMNPMMKLVLALAMIAFLGAIGGMTGCGSTPTKEPMAFIEKIEKGEVFVRRVGDPAYNKISGKESLFEGDVVKTGDGAEAVVRFATGAVTRVLPGSEFELKERKIAQTNQQTVYTRLVKGVATFYVPKNAENAKKFEVETERAIASIKGTVFKVEHRDNATYLTVAEGTVGFTHKASGKSLDVTEFFKVIADDKGLSTPEKVNTLADPDLAGDAPVIPGSRN